jgi:uncharacterized protein YjlB
MSIINVVEPYKVIHEIIKPHHLFPNNSRLPLLIYKKPLTFSKTTTKEVQKFLETNHWKNSWVNGIYDYHHYHSNTHEALIIFSGTCNVQIGGPEGNTYEITEGDVVIFPAGVAHKSLSASNDFVCIGAYPFDNDYDMQYGLATEHPKVDKNINQIKLPEMDPIFGKDGLLLQYWK